MDRERMIESDLYIVLFIYFFTLTFAILHWTWSVLYHTISAVLGHTTALVSN